MKFSDKKSNYRLIRVTTIPDSMRYLLTGQAESMRSAGFDVFMITGLGSGIKQLEEQEGSSVIIVPFSRKITPFRDLYCLIRLISIFRKLRPGIVHSHTPKAGLLSMWAAWFTGIPVILHTVAGLPWMERKGLMRQFLKWIEKMTALPATAIYPNSFSLAEFMRREKIAVNKIKVIGNGSSNGIDIDYFSPTDEIRNKALQLRREEKIDEKSWVWIFVGRVVKDKGIEELADAFDIFSKTYKDDRLWIVGEEERDLNPISVKHQYFLKNNPSVKCWGFKPDIRPFLSASQMLVFPSYREGFPNVPMQAGLMGCCLLLSDINGCNEIVRHMETGILVPPKEVHSLVNAMLLIRKNPDLRGTFAKQVQNRIKNDFSRSYVHRCILKEYKQQMAAKGLIQ